MQDKKTIRRRRGVLLLLVAVSLILLTDYFGESSSSPLHSVQRGVVEVLSPVQKAASTVLSPVRDVAGWFSSTVKAKSQNAKLVAQNDYLKRQLSQAAYWEKQGPQDQKLLGLDTSLNLKQYAPVSATLIGYDPSVWYDTIEVGKGSGSGVREYDPVVGPGGLVGDVTEVGSSYSQVTLLTSPDFAVGAMVQDSADDLGILQPKVGSPGTMLLSGLPTSSQVSAGQEVVTSGYKDPAQPSIRSLYPPDIPIGQVTSNSAQTSVLTGQQIEVTPAVDLTHLRAVQILTRPHG